MTELRDTDFPPFVAMRDAMLGMTAHVIYDAIDRNQPATLSPNAIRLIRDQLGFDGLLMTDDLSMKALTGPMHARAKTSLDAGCDVVLHCNGDMAEMMEIASSVGVLNGEGAQRADRALAARRAPEPAEIADLRARHDELTRELAVA